MEKTVGFIREKIIVKNELLSFRRKKKGIMKRRWEKMDENRIECEREKKK